MTDLLSLKQGFCEIVQKAQPWILSHFMMWLDLKVSEYKIFGYMMLEQGTNLTNFNKSEISTRAPSSDDASISPSSASTDTTSELHNSRPPCLVIPKPSLSTDHGSSSSSSSSSSIPACSTPIFKRPLFGARVSRRKQQQVFRRTSSSSLLSALSSGLNIHDSGQDSGLCSSESTIESDVCIFRNNSREGGESDVDAMSRRLWSSPDTDLSVSSSVPQAKEGDADLDSSRDISCITSAMDNSISQSAGSEDRPVVSPFDSAEVGKSTDCMILVDSHSGGSVKDGKQVREVLSTKDFIVVEEDMDHDADASERKNCKGNEVSADLKSQRSQDSAAETLADASSKPSELLGSKEPLRGASPPASTSHSSPSPDTHLLGKVKQESFLNDIQIKLEPLDPCPVESSPSNSCFRSPDTISQLSSADSGNLLQQQQFAFGSRTASSPAYIDTADWNTVSFGQYLDSSSPLQGSQANRCRNLERSSNQISTNFVMPQDSDPARTCDLCGATFRFKSSLSRHKTLHGEKRFHCFVCPKAFHRREHLLLHLQRHANSAMLTCPVCHMQASSVKHLEEHYRLNHGPFKRIGVPPYLMRDTR